ncbi:hypothetical protein Tco_1256646 [Tanacetum coccineum]
MMTWRQFILALGLHTEEEMPEAGFEAYSQGSERVIPDKGDLRDYWMEISFDRDFLGLSPSYVFILDPVRRLCHRMIAYSISGKGQAPKKVIGVDLFYLRSMDRGTANVPYLLAQYLFRHAKGRKSGTRIGDSWAWVASGPERQPDATVGASRATEDAPVADEGALIQHPCRHLSHRHLPPGLYNKGFPGSRRSGRTYQAFDSTLVGSLQLPYQRRTRRKTGEASTSAPQQPDP